ncbi:MAG: glycosyltransferase, partial [Atopobiaceae bacterium]|nr:glycosyltransferase [Atopobiaceae bacterium]
MYSGEVGLADALLGRALDESPVKVSVIVPVSNDGTTIGECLDSILAQSLREIEVVCVDRGSDDGSSEILNDYARRDGRIKVIV